MFIYIFIKYIIEPSCKTSSFVKIKNINKIKFHNVGNLLFRVVDIQF